MKGFLFVLASSYLLAGVYSRQELDLQKMEYDVYEDDEGMPALGECADDIAECLKEDGKWILTENSSFPETDTELQDACRYANMIFDCLDVKVPICINNIAYVMGYSMVVQGPKALIKDLCEPSTLRTDYLRYASCFKPLLPSASKCNNKYRTLLQDIKDLLADAGRTSDPMRRMCRSKDDLFDCLDRKSKEDCATEGAAILVRVIAPFLADPFISHYCMANFPTSTTTSTIRPTITTTDDWSLDITGNELGDAATILSLLNMSFTSASKHAFITAIILFHVHIVTRLLR